MPLAYFLRLQITFNPFTGLKTLPLGIPATVCLKLQVYYMYILDYMKSIALFLTLMYSSA